MVSGKTLKICDLNIFLSDSFSICSSEGRLPAPRRVMPLEFRDCIAKGKPRLQDRISSSRCELGIGKPKNYFWLKIIKVATSTFKYFYPTQPGYRSLPSTQDFLF